MQAFLDQVLPRNLGRYAVVTIENGIPRHHWCDSYLQVEPTITSLAAQPGHNIYYAMASFGDERNAKGQFTRAQSNVVAIRSFYIDIDCGKEKYEAHPDSAYPTREAAGTDIAKFIQATKLPMPLWVSSGNGFHLYWTVENDLTRDEWQPVADALKAAALHSGLRIDAHVTADAARILRPVETINPKGKKLVQVIAPGGQTTMEELHTALGVSQPRPKRDMSLTNALAVVRPDLPPADSFALESKCQQIGWMTTNQDKVSEPDWYRLLGVAAFCVAPEDTAKRWSDRHPSYDETRTLSKLEQWKARATGPTTCKAFKEANPTRCQGCVFLGRVTSPAALGVMYEEKPMQADDIPEQIEVTEFVQIPKPFKRTDQGVKLTVDGVDTSVCDFDVLPVSYGRDEALGYETARFLWKRQHVGWSPLVMRNAHLAAGSREFATTIADQGIVLNGKTQTETFQYMLRTYMAELQRARTTSNLHMSMGWKDNYSYFVLGNKIIRPNPHGGPGLVENTGLSQRSSANVESMWEQKGKLEDWVNSTALMERGGLSVHKFAICVSLSSIFYQIAGIDGVVLSLYGPTGTGKSLAQTIQQAVWGNPKRLLYTAKYTGNAMFSTLGFYNNLPFTIDEMTLKTPEELGDLMYSISQGRDKARLGKFGADRDPLTWSLPLTASTNISFSSILSNVAHNPEAQLARLVELRVSPHPLFNNSESGRTLYQFYLSNYGTVGLEFLRRCYEMGIEELRKRIFAHFEKFKTKYGMAFRGTDRYREGLVVLADLAHELAMEWGLVKFTFTDVMAFVGEQLQLTKDLEEEAKFDVFDQITEFCNEHARAQVVLHYTMGAGKPLQDAGKPRPMGEIRVRYELYRRDSRSPYDFGVVYIDRPVLKAWLAARGVDWHGFTSELKRCGADASPATQRYSLSKDTETKLGQTYVIGVNLGHERMAGVLDGVTQSEGTIGNLHVVK